jgi:hypothetical protein
MRRWWALSGGGGGVLNVCHIYVFVWTVSI